MKTSDKVNPLPEERCGDPNSNTYWTAREAFYAGLAVRLGYAKFKMEERNRDNNG